MTKEEFLQFGLDYYSENPKRRCTARVGGRVMCKYNPASLNLQNISKGCMIGMHLSDDAKRAYDGMTGSISDIFEIDELKYMAPKWMQEMDSDFLESCQSLHDMPSFWDEKGLTPIGKQLVKTIIHIYGLNKDLINPKYYDTDN